MSMTLDKHVTVLSILYIGINVFFFLCGGLALFFIVGGGLISGEQEAIVATTIVGLVIAGLMTALSVPGIIGGLGLVKRQGWARILVLVLGFLNLINFPLGTALGVYTIWVLMQDEAQAFFATA